MTLHVLELTHTLIVGNKTPTGAPMVSQEGAICGLRQNTPVDEYGKEVEVAGSRHRGFIHWAHASSCPSHLLDLIANTAYSHHDSSQYVIFRGHHLPPQGRHYSVLGFFLSSSFCLLEFHTSQPHVCLPAYRALYLCIVMPSSQPLPLDPLCFPCYHVGHPTASLPTTSISIACG